MFTLLTIAAALAAPGDHLPVGSAMLSPRLGLGVDVSNNALRSETPGDGAGAANLHLALGAALKHDYRDLAWNLGGTYDLRKYVTTNDARLDRFDDFTLQGTADVLRLRVVGLRAEQQLANRFTPVDTESPGRPYTTQFLSRSRAGIVVRPGSALEVTVSGVINVDDYNTASSPVAGSRDYNRRYTYGPALDLQWSFLPRTMAVLQASSSTASWSAPAIFVDGVEPIGFADSDSLRALGGVRGRVTERLTIDALAGYADATFDESTTTVGGDGVGVDVAGAQKIAVKLAGNYQLGPRDGVTLGYERDFRPSYFTNFVNFDRVSLIARRQFTPAVQGGLDTSVASERFRGQQTRDDVVLTAEGTASFAMNKWAVLRVTPGWTYRASSDANVSYNEFRGSVSLEADY